MALWLGILVVPKKVGLLLRGWQNLLHLPCSRIRIRWANADGDECIFATNGTLFGTI